MTGRLSDQRLDLTRMAAVGIRVGSTDFLRSGTAMTIYLPLVQVGASDDPYKLFLLSFSIRTTLKA